MPIVRIMLAAMLCALGANAVIAGAGPSAVPDTVYVMRHLNTPAGERDPDLTPEGQQTAQALVGWFEGKPLTAIYVSDFKRTRQTAGPLAAERGIALTLYDPRDTPALVARLKAEGGPVLVVGHSNTVPDIVEQLGGERPADLVHEDFGDIWTIKGGKSVRAKLP
ncbi:phosphoglycerate mutase family protein [Sphingomonas sp. AOB5]|uniref:phosphoglycerate mutase family protein n=1 Tax=Sphingomonas sp. AOB5 TaxID=3034017 RepID=UPI0023F6DEA6|nr:phosphoglycerate mutase family protein [Sphingomonas sp. AOB5]MDF7776960.1 phosphoglycerate mutase family protein [Sphingomonas sp. AOB5]